MRSTMVSRSSSSIDAVVRRTQADSAEVRQLSANSSEFARPVVRLDPNEPIEGDTDRIELVDSPKAAELSRRRRVARERGHSGPRAVGTSSSSTGMPRLGAETQVDPIELEMRADALALDRMMWVVMVGAGLLAVVAGLSLSAG